MKTGKFIFGFALVAIAVLFAGCFSIPVSPGKIAVDPDLPKENAAVVIFNDTINVKEYNGIDVREEWYPKGKWRRVTATMPGGETQFLFDINANFYRGNTTYTFRPKDLELKFNFEAGKEYTVALYVTKNEGSFLRPKQKVVLAIWDRIYSDANPGNSQESRVVKSWELTEF